MSLVMSDVEKKEIFKCFWYLNRITKEYKNVNEFSVRSLSNDLLLKRGGLKDDIYTAFYLVRCNLCEQQKVFLLTPEINNFESNVVAPGYKENYSLTKTHQVEFCLLDHYQTVNQFRKVDFWFDKFYIVGHMIYNFGKIDENETIIFYDCREFDFVSHFKVIQKKADEFKLNITKLLY